MVVSEGLRAQLFSLEETRADDLIKLLILDDTKNDFEFKFLFNAPSTLHKSSQKLLFCQINFTQSLLVIQLPIIFSSQHQFQFHCRVWVWKSNFYQFQGAFWSFLPFLLQLLLGADFLFHKLFLIYLSSKEKVFLASRCWNLFYFIFGRGKKKSLWVYWVSSCYWSGWRQIFTKLRFTAWVFFFFFLFCGLAS